MIQTPTHPCKLTFDAARELEKKQKVGQTYKNPEKPKIGFGFVQFPL